MSKSQSEEKLAVESGFWHLFRYNPTLKAQGKNPFILDSKQPTADLKEFLLGENRFASLWRLDRDRAEALYAQAKQENERLFALYKELAAR